MSARYSLYNMFNNKWCSVHTRDCERDHISLYTDLSSEFDIEIEYKGEKITIHAYYDRRNMEYAYIDTQLLEYLYKEKMKNVNHGLTS